MKHPFTFVAIVIALVTGVWGYAFELAYFAYLKLNVHTIFGPVHFVHSGLSVIGPMFAMLLGFALLMKFFSRNLAQDDLRAVSERLSKSKFAEEIRMARSGFLLSLVFLLLVIFDIRPPTFGEGRSTGLGFMFWLFTFFNIQLFFGSVCLSPPHSRGAVVAAFILAVSMCFAAGGIDAARLSIQSDKVLRDDSLVNVYRNGAELIVKPKPVSLLLPFWNHAMQWIGAR